MTLWLVVVVALLGGCRAVGGSEPSGEGSPAQPEAVGARFVSITAGEDGFSPRRVTVDKGRKTVLQIRLSSDSANIPNVVIPELSLSVPLTVDRVVDIEVPAMTAHRYTLRSPDNRHRGEVIIK